MLRIITLMENEKANHGSLINEHGLSFYIEYNGKRFLFDTGATGDFLKNADALGVNLDQLDGLIISHNHFDHGGGFLDFAKRKYKMPVLYTGKDFFDYKYKTGEGNKMTLISSGITEKVLSQYNVKHVVCSNVFKLTEGAYVISGFESLNDFEKPTMNFLRETSDCKGIEDFKVDDFREEASLVFETDKGLVFLVGCSHPGIVNMIMKVQKVFDKPIYAVYGGTHLVAADDERIEKTLDFCAKSGIKVLGMCHCTGAHGEEKVREHGAFEAAHLAPGDVVLL